MSRTLRRASVTEVEVERFVQFDGQSSASYDAVQKIMARVVREDQVQKRADGTEVRTQYSVWVDAGELVVPIWHDRLTFDTLGERRTAIVEFHDERKTLKGVIDHVKLLCREE